MIFSPRTDKRQSDAPSRAGLWFSAFLVALSFVSFLIPLAAYHLAQVGAALKTRAAVFLLAAVAASCLILGSVLKSEALISGGFGALLWAPILLGLVVLRSRGWSKIFALILSGLPLIAALGVLLFSAKLGDEDVAKMKLQLQTTHQKILVDSGKQADPTFKAAVDQNLEQVEKFFQSEAFGVLRTVSQMHRSQRIFWFVYGPGNGFFFFLVLICIGNLLLVDIAHSQVSRFRALFKFILEKQGEFPQDLLLRLKSQPLPTWISGSPETNLEPRVLGHRVLFPPAQEGPFWKGLLAAAWKPKSSPSHSNYWGWQFEFSKGPWELRGLVVPIWLALPAVIWLGVVVGLNPTHFQSLEAASAPTSVPPGDLNAAFLFFETWGSAGRGLAASASVLSFLTLCALCVQGVLVLYARLTPLILIFFILVLLVSGPVFALNPFLAMAFLGGLGLLDEALDLRGCRGSFSSIPPRGGLHSR